METFLVRVLGFDKVDEWLTGYSVQVPCKDHPGLWITGNPVNMVNCLVYFLPRHYVLPRASVIAFP